MLDDSIDVSIYRFVLDGDREELRHIRQELEALRNHARSAVVGTVATPGAGSGSTPLAPVSSNKSNARATSSSVNAKSDAAQDSVLERLRNEKQDLLSTGLYDQKDSIIEELDRSIHSRLQVLAGAV